MNYDNFIPFVGHLLRMSELFWVADEEQVYKPILLFLEAT